MEISTPAGRSARSSRSATACQLKRDPCTRRRPQPLRGSGIGELEHRSRQRLRIPGIDETTTVPHGVRRTADRRSDAGNPGRGPFQVNDAERLVLGGDHHAGRAGEQILESPARMLRTEREVAVTGDARSLDRRMAADQASDAAG